MKRASKQNASGMFWWQWRHKNLEDCS